MGQYVTSNLWSMIEDEDMWSLLIRELETAVQLFWGCTPNMALAAQ